MSRKKKGQRFETRDADERLRYVALYKSIRIQKFNLNSSKVIFQADRSVSFDLKMNGRNSMATGFELA